MDIDYLRTIVCILEEGSYNKAAQRLNCSQSTVTFHVQQVEKELSVTLFERVGRRMTLTDAGKDLLPHIRAILDETDYLKGYSGYGRSVLIRVGVPDELFCYGFEMVLSVLRRETPELNVIALPMKCHEIREAIVRNELDIGIHCDIGGYPDTVIEERVTMFYPKVVVSSGTKDRDYITAGQRKDIPLMTSDVNSVHMCRFLRYLDDRDITMDTVELNSTRAVMINLINGLCAACLPDFVVGEELHSGRLIEVSNDMDVSPIPVVFVCRENRSADAAISFFRESVEEALRR